MPPSDQNDSSFIIYGWPFLRSPSFGFPALLFMIMYFWWWNFAWRAFGSWCGSIVPLKDCFFDLKYCRSPSKFSSVAPRARKGQVVNKLLMDCAWFVPFFVSFWFSPELWKLRKKSATGMIGFLPFPPFLRRENTQFVPGMTVGATSGQPGSFRCAAILCGKTAKGC